MPSTSPASMTGFGAAQGPSPWGLLRVEVHTLNHRHLDVAVRLPRGWPALDSAVRESVGRRFVRGRVEVAVVAQDFEASRRTVRVNESVLRQYWEQLTQIQQKLQVARSLSLADLLSLPDVVTLEEPPVDEQAAWGTLAPLLDAALDQVQQMRHAEGGRLWQDIAARLDAIEASIGQFQRDLAGRFRDAYYQRLVRRVGELLNSGGLTSLPGVLQDEALLQRLAQEVAIAAERADISEELTRLSSHVAQMRRLAAEVAPGRRMEFLLREMDRELSTATAKVPEAPGVHRLIELRAELERIREQILNLE